MNFSMQANLAAVIRTWYRGNDGRMSQVLEKDRVEPHNYLDPRDKTLRLIQGVYEI